MRHLIVSWIFFLFVGVITTEDFNVTSNVQPSRGRLATIPEMTVHNHLAHFMRERIVERVVHAKGAGAHGVFRVSGDIRNYTKAVPFASIGKETPIFVRFSTTAESGSADTILDTRGMGIKFYTEEGNYDLVLNDLPVFPIRYPALFPSFVRSFKRDPKTHLKNPVMFWDFAGLRPETTHHHVMLFTDFAYPQGYRHMDWAGVHTFKLVNSKNQPTYCKIHLKTKQGVKFFTRQEADTIAGENPDYAIQDLMEAIEAKQYPQYDLYIQVMTYSQARTLKDNPFDITKIWPEDSFPFIKVGTLELNRNPSDYFTEVELAAFDPGNLVPGIYLSPDPMLRARSIHYHDASRYRLGANYNAFAINRPSGVPNTPDRPPLDTEFIRDGQCATPESNSLTVPYFPNSFGGPSLMDHDRDPTGDVDRPLDDEETVPEDFDQVRTFLKKIEKDKGKMDRLVDNIAVSFVGVTDPILNRALENFKRVDPTFEKKLRHQIRRRQREADERNRRKKF